MPRSAADRTVRGAQALRVFSVCRRPKPDQFVQQRFLFNFTFFLVLFSVYWWLRLYCICKICVVLSLWILKKLLSLSMLRLLCYYAIINISIWYSIMIDSSNCFLAEKSLNLQRYTMKFLYLLMHHLQLSLIKLLELKMGWSTKQVIYAQYFFPSGIFCLLGYTPHTKFFQVSL